MSTETTKVMLAVRISAPIKQALEALAKTEDRSVSKQLERILVAALTEAGYLGGKAKQKG